MVTAVLNDDRLAELKVFGTPEPSVGLEDRGTEYPRQDDSPSYPKAKTSRIGINQEVEKAALWQRLESALWASMPIAPIEINSEATLEDLIQAYNASWNRLRQLRADIGQLVRQICATNLEWKSETDTQVPQAQQQLVESTINEMTARVTQAFIPSRSILTAEVANWSLKTVRRRFTASIRGDLHRFCRFVESTLQEMVQLQLIGILEWVGPNACKYHFFTEVLCHDGTTHEESDLKRRERSWSERSNSQLTRFATYITKTTTALISHRRARHEHHVLHAFQTTIANSTVTALPRHRQLLDAIPIWLREFVRVIDGTLIQEWVIEQEFCRKTWSKVDVYDLPQFDCEPAIIIDQFALSGWGPREIQQEVQRVAEERITTTKAAADIEWKWWLTGVFPTALAFIGTAGFRPDLWPLAILALTACLFSVIQVVATLQRAGRESGDVFQYVTSLLTTLTVCGAGALLISCFRGPVDSAPWWFLVSCLLATSSMIGMHSAFDSVKSLGE